MPTFEVLGHHCDRCGHAWVPRTWRETRNDPGLLAATAPRVCPKCKSPYWNRGPAQTRAAPKPRERKAATQRPPEAIPDQSGPPLVARLPEWAAGAIARSHARSG